MKTNQERQDSIHQANQARRKRNPACTTPQVLPAVYRTAGVEVGSWLPNFSSIGCYTIIYYTRRADPVCGTCATVWEDDCNKITFCGTYDEGADVECCECGIKIESSYGEPEASPPSLPSVSQAVTAR